MKSVAAFLVVLAFALPSLASDTIDNMCQIDNPAAFGWAGLCQTEDDWIAGWYVHQYGWEWTVVNRPRLGHVLVHKPHHCCLNDASLSIAASASCSGITEELVWAVLEYFAHHLSDDEASAIIERGWMVYGEYRYTVSGPPKGSWEWSSIHFVCVAFLG